MIRLLDNFSYAVADSNILIKALLLGLSNSWHLPLFMINEKIISDLVVGLCVTEFDSQGFGYASKTKPETKPEEADRES